jgi:hypothetical protein
MHTVGGSPGQRATWRALVGATAALLALSACVAITNPPAATPTLGPTSFATPGPTATPEVFFEPTEKPTPRPTRTRRPRRTQQVEPTPRPTRTPRRTRRPRPTPTEAAVAVTPGPPPPTGGTPPNPPGWPDEAHDSNEAAQHEGEAGVVCGVVVAVSYVPTAPGRPTFLNVDHPYPDQTFNVVIWGEQRRNWPLAQKPEISMMGRTVCARGLIEGFRDYTQIQDVNIDDVTIVP